MEAVTKSRLALPLVESLIATLDLRKVLAAAAENLGIALNASSVVVLLCDSDTSQPPIEWSAPDFEPDTRFDAALLALSRRLQRLALPLPQPLVLQKTAPVLKGLRKALEDLQVTHVAAATARSHGIPNATVVLYRRDEAAWEGEEIDLLDYVMHFLGLAVENCFAASRSAAKTEAVTIPTPLPAATPRAPAEARYERMVENADAIVFHVDTNHVITFISSRAVEFFGIAPDDFVAGTAVHWYELAHLSDRERLERKAEDSGRTGAGFDEEFRIINHISGRLRWILAKFVPVRTPDGVLVGWDGFGIDITARREAQEALDEQSKKVRALYTVSSAIRGYLDPANIASRGLAALCEATGADAGVCYLYSGKETESLQLVAHHGFSADFVDRVEKKSNVPSLSQYVAEHGQPIVIPDLRTDPRSSRVLADEEGVRSAVLVPISVEEETLGALGLFNQRVSKFDGGDVMLVAAAANQIGLAARQAHLFAAYRKQTKNLAALYRISHELSAFLSLDEIFQSAFGIIRDELDLRRLWLGLLNEAGTRIVGQAAYGPGWKKRLVEMNVEIEGREHPIAQVVTTRKALIIDNPEEALGAFGIRRFFSRFGIHNIGLVPLIAGGQVLGVLAFQPEPDQPKLEEEEMTLLSSLASEIAAVVLSKRLEERIAQGEKMRAAGLLAAGIAHNFNNLLQAILGQASLLEMQFQSEQRITKPAKTINEAAQKGAALVKQLVSFANLEDPISEMCDVNAVIERSKGSIARNLKDEQKIDLALNEGLPRAYVDPRQLLRILQTLATNAGEAMPADGVIHIFTDNVQVGRESPHYEVPYGDYVRIGVRDEGVGMDAETKRRCFEPFFTTKNLDPRSGLSLTGSGLSLAAAYALTRKNGGRLVVDSQPGKGSTFTIYLPAKVDVRGETGDQAQESEPLQIEVQRMRRAERTTVREKSVEAQRRGNTGKKSKEYEN